MPNKTKKLISVFLIILVFMTACAKKTVKSGESELSVVTTVFPLYDFSLRLCGDKADVTMLLPTGADAHSYEPTVQDIIKINESDLFISIGGSSDVWAEATLKGSAESDINTLFVSEGLNLIKEDEHGHETETFDEHVWASPENAILIVSLICDELCRISPENEDYFRKNELELTKELNTLSKEYLKAVNNGRLKTVVFADRFPFRYLARDYSLEYSAAFPGCSSESEPSAVTVAKLIDKVKAEKIPVVFYTETSNQKMADAIAEETGAKKLLMHSCHSVTKKQLEENITYVKLMNENLAALKEALK